MNSPVNSTNPIKLFPKSQWWVALIGDDIQTGITGMGRSPDIAIEKLLEKSEALALIPHGIWELVCPECGYQGVYSMPYPFPHDSTGCGKCGAQIPVTNELDDAEPCTD